MVSSTVTTSAVGAARGNVIRNSGGVTIVVTSTMITDAENTSRPIRLLASPYPATMSPTSPREIMPTPTRIDSCVLNPKARANTPHPVALPTIATTRSTIVKAARSPSSRAFACNPMLMKKIGTNIEYVRGCTPSSMRALNGVCAKSTPARYEPVMAATDPMYSAAQAYRNATTSTAASTAWLTPSRDAQPSTGVNQRPAKMPAAKNAAIRRPTSMICQRSTPSCEALANATTSDKTMIPITSSMTAA